MSWPHAKKMSSSLRKICYHLDVGKEKLLKVDSKLCAFRFVPRHVLANYALFFESGIFEWWHSLVISSGSFTESLNLKQVKQSMNGNSLVIFILWLAALGFDVAIFGAEKWAYLCTTEILVLKLYF